jgi:hypothetical protein
MSTWPLAWARFEALRNNHPTSWDKTAVRQYHEIVSGLEEATPGVDLSELRVLDSELNPRLVSAQRTGISGKPGSRTYSKVRYCNDQDMRRRIKAIYLFFQHQQPPPQSGKIGFSA